jgi:hypothetical protein
MTGDSYPCLLDGIAFIPVRGGYLAEGAPARKTFTGRIPRLLFGSLLPLLDGHLSTAEVAARLGVSPAVADAVVTLLEREGLVRTGARSISGRRDSHPARVYLCRTYGWNRGQAIWRRLQRSAVTVRGDTQVTGLICEILKRSGIETGSAPPGRRPGLVVEVLTGSAAARAGTAVLPVRRGPLGFSIGPVSGMPGAVCPECASVPADPGATTTGQPGSLLATVAAATAGAVLRLVGDYGSSRFRHQVIDVPDADALPRARDVVPRHSCECRRALIAGGQPGDPNPLAGPGGPVAPRVAKHYLTERRRPAAVVVGETVAWLLAASSGGPLRDGDLQPGAAVGPGGIRAYLCLPDGSLCYYDARSRELVQLARPASGGPSDTPNGREPVQIVLTGDLAALLPVFGDQASRRLIQQDTGLMLARLAYGARAVGWQVRAIPADADALTAALDIDPGREAVTAVTALTPASADGGRLHGKRTAMRLMRANRQVYAFAGGEIRIDGMRRIMRNALAGSAAIWRPADWTDSRIEGLAFLRSFGARSPAQVEDYLEDRGITAAGVLIFGARIPDGGSLDPPVSLSMSATAAGLAQFASARKGLQAGLIARLPEAVIAATVPDPSMAGTAYGCAIGYASDKSSQTTVVVW